MGSLAILGGNPVFERELDYRKIWPPVDAKTAERLQALYYSGRWTAFDETEPEFAQAFADYHGARHGIFMVNGTVTLHSALAALGVGPGDEVIVPPLTWYATAIAVCHVGACPVFVDIEPNTLCIDPKKIEAAITPRTKAIIPVHAYGSMADMDAIMDIAKRHNVRVIEDCAHMHGGVWNGRKVGSIGDVGSFSFQHTKTMSSGEGGICITSDADLAERIFRIKQIGYAPGQLPRQAKSGPPTGLLCYNFRATAFHPLILQSQLEGLEARLKRYTASVNWLENRLRQTTKLRFQSPGRRADCQGRFGWPMIFDDPAYVNVPLSRVQAALKAEGLPLIVAEGPIYKFILFNVPPGSYRVGAPCDVTERTCARMLWLLHPFLGLEESELELIATAIEKVLKDINSLEQK